ncbi:hypothetical protein G5V58_02590 [Nocardioides anomalus]|uniref:Calcineurin-like phosphoesterase domain-containing protein n=1 Tax=Nocardioides anomalus TaxID=2712223 RepID=A0A6G6W8Y4_9ACTN|nr:metallophosphoesterase [Nocardioides anomalus]QIG41811.1 hypothetical protein G5V58_02590 [Nocardioides anomalus]
MITLAHLSDTHVGGPPDARSRAERLVDHLLAMEPRPDALLVSGDIADHGRPEEYDEAVAVLDRWPGPRLVLTGNHDVRAPFRAAIEPFRSGTQPFASGTGSFGSGTESFASGTEPIASGTQSIGSGTESFGSGTESFASGTQSFGSGTESFGSGTESFASGTESFGSGIEPFASGAESFAAATEPFPSGTEPFSAGTDRFQNGTIPPVVGAVELDGLRLVGLDSLVDAVDGVRQDHGELDDDQLAWLDASLAEDDRPTFVCLHHPPVDIGLELMAPILLREPERLEDVLRRHPHVVATLVGHAHTAGATTFAGRPLLVGGGSASTVTLDAEPLGRIWQDAPPTLALHLLHDDGRLTTHWRAL